MISMIPTDSRLSCGLICHALHAAAPELRERTAVVARFWDDPAFVALQRAHVVAQFPQASPDRNCCLVLVLHGTILRDPKGGAPGFHTGVTEKDVYGEALRAALLAVPDSPWQRVELAYLNHGVGGEWSQPTVPELLSRLASEGVDCVVAYPCEHLVEGSETLGLPRLLAASAIPETHQLPCLNVTAAFIEYLAECVRAAGADDQPSRLCDPCPLARS
jgi:ferrochelatase